MCGRFVITLPAEAMARLFEAAPANDLPATPDYNVCPTLPVPVVRRAEAGRQLVAMRWGFVPRWAKRVTDGPLLINARAESVAEKPAFREAARARRGLIPAAGFYEWTRDAEDRRLPWYIHPTADAPLALAAIWQDWTGPQGETLTSCAIVTCAANERLSAIHHRMPVVVAPRDWPLWLGEVGHGAARLMRPAPEASLAFHRVDAQVNSNRAAGPALVAPLAQ